MAAPHAVRRALLGALVVLAASCSGRGPERATDPAGRAIALARAGRVRVEARGFTPGRHVLDAAHASLARSHAAAGLELARADADDLAAPRQVLATVDSELGAALLERAGGERLPEGGFRFAGRRFTGDLDLVRVAMADPERPGLPLAAWLANRPGALSRAAERCELAMRPRFECYRDGELIAWGRLTADGPVVEDDVAAIRDRWRATGLVSRTSDAAPPDGPMASGSIGDVVVHPGEPAALAEYARVFGGLATTYSEPTARRTHTYSRLSARTTTDDSTDTSATAAERPWHGLLVQVPADPLATLSWASAGGDASARADLVLAWWTCDVAASSPHLARTWRDPAADASSLSSRDHVRVAAAVARAKDAGRRVIFAPRLLESHGTGLAAQHKQVDDRARARFAERFTAHLVEQARFARACGADGLVLGRALPSVTRTRTGSIEREEGFEVTESDAAIRARWAAMWDAALERVRAEYDGDLIYLAGDVRELDRIGFRDRLDVIGVELTPRLADAGGPRRVERLATRYAAQLARARAVVGDTPLVVVASMPATAGAPRDPRSPRGPFDESVQRDALDALRVVVAEADPPLAGVLLDEWAIDPERRGGRGRDLARASLSDALEALFETLDDSADEGADEAMDEAARDGAEQR